jgi:hypothetical protein
MGLSKITRSFKTELLIQRGYTILPRIRTLRFLVNLV